MEVRQRTTLLDQMAISKSPNLRDLLKAREENERRETLTLGSILGCSARSNLEIAAAAAEAASRTLLDIIREEGTGSDAYTAIISANATGGSSSSSSAANCKISWKFFKDRLLLRRSAAAAATLISADFIDSRSRTEDEPRDNATEISGHIRSPEAVHMDLAAALAEERRQQLQRREAGDVSPTRVSLMALLEQTDLCPTAMHGEGEEEGEEEQEAGMEGEERGRREIVCCVCMVRKKGAAFIPCGHTFCRMCSRELWISRGNCPLCNASIVEILDIF